MINGLKLYYPIEGGIQTKNTAVASSILKNDNAKTIVAYLLAHPGAHQREIARALSVNHGTVRWHLKKLVTANVVNEHPEGAAYKYYISTSGMETLGATSEMAEAVAENAAQAATSPMATSLPASAEFELERDSGL
jgi:predicted transcriptional regulator